jgi:hypothetical protein
VGAAQVGERGTEDVERTGQVRVNQLVPVFEGEPVQVPVGDVGAGGDHDRVDTGCLGDVVDGNRDLLGPGDVAPVRAEQAARSTA